MTRRRLDDIPVVASARATALVASITDPKALRSGGNFSALPKRNSSAGKDRLGNIGKRGDRYRWRRFCYEQRIGMAVRRALLRVNPRSIAGNVAKPRDLMHS